MTSSSSSASRASPSDAGSGFVTLWRAAAEAVLDLLQRRTQLAAAVQAVQAGREHRREGEVGVAARVREAQLQAGAEDLARGGVAGDRRRDADQGAAAVAAPASGDRRLVAGHEALVRVDDRGDERAHARRVVELAGQERLGDGR